MAEYTKSRISERRMGRRKLEIKPIEDKSARQVTFSKRRNGLLKKAKELSILCEAEVAVIIYSCRGKLYRYCSSNSLKRTLQRHQNYIESCPNNGACEAQREEAQHSEYSQYITKAELLQIVEREFRESSEDQHSVAELILLESQLEAALIQTKTAKTDLLLDSISGLHDKERMLLEENRLLEEKIAAGEIQLKKVIPDLNIIPDVRINE